MTRATPDRIRDVTIDIPRKLIHQKDDFTLFLDLFYINNLPMLNTIDSPIRNRALVCLNNRESHGFLKALDVVLRNYNKAGYRVSSIHCNNEFTTMVEPIQDDLDIEIT